jgi:hypothetical protein
MYEKDKEKDTFYKFSFPISEGTNGSTAENQKSIAENQKNIAENEKNISEIDIDVLFSVSDTKWNK